MGKFALIETTHGRYHIEIKPGISRKTIRRIARLIWLHSKSHPGSKLNMLHQGREKTYGLIKNLSQQKIDAFVALAAKQGGTFVVVSEKIGGALDSPFWKHHRMVNLLSAR
jgi:hypothetical protein